MVGHPPHYTIVTTTMTDDYVERATTFDGLDAPPGDRLDGSESLADHYDRLSVWNRLDWNGKWKDRNRETAKNTIAIVDAIAGQLSLTDYQKQEARRFMSELPPEMNQSHQTSLLAVVVCAITANRDGREYHPNDLQRDEDSELGVLADDLDIRYTQLYKCWRRVQREVA